MVDEDEAGPDGLDEVGLGKDAEQVQLVVDANNARATVRGRMPTFVDLGQTRVSEQATRPREQVTRP